MSKTYFPASIIIDGRVVHPEGWMYIAAFALADCDWAIKACKEHDIPRLAREYKRQGDIADKTQELLKAEASVKKLKHQLSILENEEALPSILH